MSEDESIVITADLPRDELVEASIGVRSKGRFACPASLRRTLRPRRPPAGGSGQGSGAGGRRLSAGPQPATNDDNTMAIPVVVYKVDRVGDRQVAGRYNHQVRAT